MKSLTDILDRAGVDDGSVLLLAGEIDYYIQTLESKVGRLEGDLQNLKDVLIKVSKFVRFYGNGECPVCGSMMDEYCDDDCLIKKELL